MTEPAPPIPSYVISALEALKCYFLETRPNPIPGEPDVPELSFTIGEYESRHHLDAYFARLSFAVLDEDRFEVRDCRSQLLGIWHREGFDKVLNFLGKLNFTLPGAATYVMLNDDGVIHQWKLNVAHHSKKHRERRIDDLPGMAGDKSARTASLIDELNSIA